MEKRDKHTNNNKPSERHTSSSALSLDHRSPPPSDLRHVSQSPAPAQETNNNNEFSKTYSATSSPEPSPLSSLGHVSPPSPSDLRHVSRSPAPAQETNHPITTNNNNNDKFSKTRSATSSPELSPLSSLGHVSPPTPFDLRHVSQSPATAQETNYPVSTDNNNNNKFSKTRSAMSSSEPSPLSSLGHMSPPAPSDIRHVAGKRARQSVFVLRAARREKAVRRAALGFRVCGSVFCLVSLAVMAADKDRGWAIDSFYRYKEFRYCISVNVVGFLYSVAQTCYLAFTMCTGKYVLRHQYRFYFDFAMDQILTYLLMSASSSAATRVDDWESNWGKDEFPMMANISVGLSFMSFVVLAASTLISGYALCTWSSS